MKLEGKKQLAARALGVGKNRIVFNTERTLEIKEAITKQDIKDLLADKAIAIKETKGRRTITKRKTRRRMGSVKKKVKNKKQEYIKITRKLRRHLLNLKNRKLISNSDFLRLRKEIRARNFRSLTHLKERISNLEK